LLTLPALSLGQEAVANAPASVEDPAVKDSEHSIWNVQVATYGGKQFWTDQAILAGWRVQRNAVTGHCRLLDPDDERRAWGTLEQCETKLEEVRREKNLQPPRGKIVICLHGLLRSRHQMQPLANWLAKEGKYDVVNFNYASSRAEVGEHAEALARVISKYSEATEINFVAHSLGNIVLRHYLGDVARGANGTKPDTRLHRIVMLGPPSNGAEFAKRFSENRLFQVVAGKSGQQLADNWAKLEPKLVTPACEFGIIAGGQGTKVGLNPLVTGDDDGIVAVSETKLAGACDFLVSPVIHGELMNDPTTRKSILSFLKDGYFIAADKRCPIPAEAASTEGADDR
jgi:pimeloyl-ACP methyl ester carboxylesterase